MNEGGQVTETESEQELLKKRHEHDSSEEEGDIVSEEEGKTPQQSEYVIQLLSKKQVEELDKFL